MIIKLQEQNHSQSHQLGYLRNQFNLIETDENYHHGIGTRE